AADMTLTDDNFATIVKAIEEGRGIYDNIKKVVGFLLGTNIGEIFTVFFAMLFWHTSPLLSTQLLWINLVTDGLPAIALGMEAVDKDVMSKKPKPKNESIFANGLGLRVVIQGLMFALLTLFAFNYGKEYSGDLTMGRTMAFMTLALTQVSHSFNMRSNRSIFKIGPFSNKYLSGAALLSLVLVLVVSFVPAIAKVFGLTMLEPFMYLIVLGLVLVPVVVLEITKAIGLIRHHE
ncbi:MAG TPA: cation-transporting P-type ATPase, partial [Clostridiales bacterium]|nr:cation-transporting P-type ATPase [Clostridiales bacterium]